jgi:hypothetical protein
VPPQEGERLGSGAEAANVDTGTAQKVERILSNEQFVLHNDHESALLGHASFTYIKQIPALAPGSSPVMGMVCAASPKLVSAAKL